MAAFVDEGKRIPRRTARGEIGLTSNKISKYEDVFDDSHYLLPLMMSP